MSTRDFDLFAFLERLNKRDLQAFDKLSDEGKKAASPLVIMRWLSGTSDPAQIVRLNEFSNKYVFSLGQDKSLLFKLLASSCTGRTNRASWLKGPGGGSKRLAVQALQDKFNCSSREALGYMDLLEPEDIVRFADEAGWEKEELKKLSAELDKGNDIGSPRTEKSGRKPKK